MAINTAYLNKEKVKGEKKMRLISANALIELANSRKDGTVDANDIARFPTIEAEPVRNRTWVIKTHDDGYGAYQVKHCPDCDRGLPVEYDADYCPKCGAKMDGKENKE